jgi:hypothetical protein
MPGILSVSNGKQVATQPKQNGRGTKDYSRLEWLGYFAKPAKDFGFCFIGSQHGFADCLTKSRGRVKQLWAFNTRARPNTASSRRRFATLRGAADAGRWAACCKHKSDAIALPKIIRHMEQSLLSNLVRQHFRYLTDEYGFSLARDAYFPESMENADMLFVSSQTGVRIVLDRGQVLINIGSLLQPQQEWFEFSDVVHFFAPETEPVYIFSQDNSNYHATIESQVIRVARLMHQYCEPLLRGDFSMQSGIREIERQRVAKLLDDLNKLAENYRRSQAGHASSKS